MQRIHKRKNGNNTKRRRRMRKSGGRMDLKIKKLQVLLKLESKYF